MKTVYFNIAGSAGGGGPSVFVLKASRELRRRGHRIIYEKPEIADWAIAIIETGKLRRHLKGKNTKILLRTDGIYNEEYNKLFNRAIRPDMSALHVKLKSDIPAVDWVVFQSTWSKDRIDDEIVKRSNNCSVINNGVDINTFKPTNRAADGYLNLIHVGKMRDGYLMRMLVGTYKELKNRGIKCRLLLAGTMDADCLSEFYAGKEEGIIRMGQFSNDKLSEVYGQGDIFLDIRQGASCNNVVAEAQACGLPVIAPSWGGSIDMVKNQETGWIVNTGHWTYDQNYIIGISDAICEVNKDLAGFKFRSREHAVKELSIEKMIDKYLESMRILDG